MFRHTTQACVLFLGLVMLAGGQSTRTGRSLHPNNTLSSTCDCEYEWLQIERFVNLHWERLTNVLLEDMQLQEERAERRAQEASRLQDEKTAAALQEVVRQVGQLLQERDEALRSMLDERLQRLQEDAAAAPGAPCHSPFLPAVLPIPLPVCHPPSLRHLLPLPLRFHEREPARRPRPASASVAPSAHDGQTERTWVQQRHKEARRQSAEAQPPSLGEALLDAAEKGSLDETRRLLDEGADVNYTSSHSGTSPLSAAAASYAYSNSSSEDVVALLLSRGADVSAVDVKGWTALHYAAIIGNSAVVRLLLGAGADVDAREEHGRTPLHLAAYTNEEAAVRALLAAGARKDLTACNGYWEGKTPYDLANTDAVLNLLRP